MFVSSTELQNNFGKYLMLAAREEIIITRNGTPVAKLAGFPERTEDGERFSSAEIMMEKAEKYPDSPGKATCEAFRALSRDSEERYNISTDKSFCWHRPRRRISMRSWNFPSNYNWFGGKSCRPFAAPYEIELHRKADDGIHVVQPDLMVICDLEQHLNEEDHYTDTPSLVVEILSESTRRKDLIYKLNLYMTCGVREYWIVNPFTKEVTVYLFRHEDIANQATFRAGEKSASFLFPGLLADVGRLFDHDVSPLGQFHFKRHRVGRTGGRQSLKDKAFPEPRPAEHQPPEQRLRRAPVEIHPLNGRIFSEKTPEIIGHRIADLIVPAIFPPTTLQHVPKPDPLVQKKCKPLRIVRIRRLTEQGIDHLPKLVAGIRVILPFLQ